MFPLNTFAQESESESDAGPCVPDWRPVHARSRSRVLDNQHVARREPVYIRGPRPSRFGFVAGFLCGAAIIAGMMAALWFVW